jgi:hypothetical protein
MSVEQFLERGLWLDLETGMERLNAVGGFLGLETFSESTANGMLAALARLDTLANRAAYGANAPDFTLVPASAEDTVNA